MTNLFINMSHFERVNLFVLSSKKHGRDTNEMKIFWFQSLFGELEKSVHEVNSKEVCLILAFVTA